MKLLSIKTVILVAILSSGLFAQADSIYNKKSFWGWNVGGVFTEVPISQAVDSGFAVLMAQIYYSYYLSNPQETFRTAVSLGVYGFQIVLPVPEVSIDLLAGNPNSELQFKGSIGTFYDITVGGHGGVFLGAGVLLKNRFNVSFFIVPFGKDAERDYLEFVGARDVAKPCLEENPCVDIPYFGLFVGFQY